MKKQNKEKIKHVPMRMCVVTREKLPKKELVRIVFLQDTHEVKVDDGSRLRGRGLNIKPSLEVFEEGMKRKIIQRTFGVQLNLEEIEKLKDAFNEYILKNHTEKKVVRISSEQLNKIIK